MGYFAEAQGQWLTRQDITKDAKNRLSPKFLYVKTLLTVLVSALQITSALLYFPALDLTFVAQKRHLFWNNRQ